MTEKTRGFSLRLLNAESCRLIVLKGMEREEPNVIPGVPLVMATLRWYSPSSIDPSSSGMGGANIEQIH